MDFKKILQEIKNSYNKDSKTRTQSFLDYKNLLNKQVELGTLDANILGVLAILRIELNEDTEIVFNDLEKWYYDNMDKLTNDNSCIILTNMAYLLVNECIYNEEKIVTFLKEAINKNSNYPNTYYAYGLFLFEKENYIEASKLFNKAYTLKESPKYKYCEALSLFNAKEIKQATALLESIYTGKLEDDTLSGNIAILYAECLRLLGDIEKYKEIGTKLLNFEFNYTPMDMYMINYLFNIEEYQKCIDLYDEIDYYYDASWLGSYFYCLKKLKKIDVAKSKLKKIIKNLNDMIIRENLNSDDFDNDIELENYIINHKQLIDDIKNIYNDIFVKNIEINNEFQSTFYYECYYINCPRHFETYD